MIATQSNNATLESDHYDAEANKKHCVFRSGGHWFAIPAIVVREIATSPELVRIPECHRSLAGVCHLRAEFIPAISINGILGVDANCHEETESTLVVINDKATWALLIAEAGSIETLEVLGNAEQRQTDSGQDATDGSFELGTAMHRDQIIRVLDHTKVYQRAQQLIENTWVSPDNSLRTTHAPLELLGEKPNPSHGVNDETE